MAAANDDAPTSPTTAVAPSIYRTTKQRWIDLAELAAKRADALSLSPLPGLESGTATPLVATIALDGSAPPDQRPALLVVGGLEPNDPLGPELATRLINDVVTSASAGGDMRQWLTHSTLYVIPVAVPEYALLREEQPGVAVTRTKAPGHDDDRDGLIDEDPSDDLDADGIIAVMRVPDVAGTWRQDDKDPHLMVPARPDRGELGGWLVVPEGWDNDQDGTFNEDGEGGVNIGRSFPYDFPWFDADAGDVQLRDPIARALSDFVIKRPNIAAVIDLGKGDTFAKPPEGKDQEMRGRKPIEAWDSADAKLLAPLVTSWEKTLGLPEKRELPDEKRRGDLASWAYYHQGRLGISYRPWSIDLDLALPKTDDAATSESKKSDDSDDDIGEEAKKIRRYAGWFAKNHPAAVLPWTPVTDNKLRIVGVEAGGWNPGLVDRPPETRRLDDLLTSHSLVLSGMLASLPRLQLGEPIVTSLGAGSYRIEVGVSNVGKWPTMLKHRERIRETVPVMLETNLPPEQVVGLPRQKLDVLQGGAGVVARVVVMPAEGTKTVAVRIGCASTGWQVVEVTLP